MSTQVEFYAFSQDDANTNHQQCFTEMEENYQEEYEYQEEEEEEEEESEEEDFEEYKEKEPDIEDNLLY
jgi:hypothetical protein